MIKIKYTKAEQKERDLVDKEAKKRLYTNIAPQYDHWYGQKNLEVTKDFPKKDDIWIALNDYAIILKPKTMEFSFHDYGE